MKTTVPSGSTAAGAGRGSSRTTEEVTFGGGMSNDFLGDPDVPELFATLKGLLDTVNVEDKGCTERVYRGLCSGMAAPGHLSHLERPNYDFAAYLSRMTRN